MVSIACTRCSEIIDECLSVLRSNYDAFPSSMKKELGRWRGGKDETR
jgi:hypothetical protein